MRNLHDRARVYADERMRELYDGFGKLVVTNRDELAAVVASTFRDAVLVAEREASESNGVRVRGATR